jgi:minichromosome maintenance protein 10
MEDEGDELSEFLDLLEEDCAADAASSSQQTLPSAAPSTTGLREILDPNDFLRPQDDAAPSAIHAGDTDSSDDEDNRNCQEQSFNSSGRDVKQMMTAKEKESKDKTFSLGGLKGYTQKSVQNDPKVSWSRNQAIAIQGPVALKKAERVSGLTGKLLDVADRDCFLEPVSGIRVL